MTGRITTDRRRLRSTRARSTIVKKQASRNGTCKVTFELAAEVAAAAHVR